MEENYSAPGYRPVWVLCSPCLLWIEIHVLLSKGIGLAGVRTGLQSDSPKLRQRVCSYEGSIVVAFVNGTVTFRSLQQHNVS